MSRVMIALLIVVSTAACGPQQKGKTDNSELWSDGKSDLTGLGVTFSLPSDLEGRTGTGASMVWVATSGDESLTVSYEVTLASSTINQWVENNLTLSDGTEVKALSAASPSSGRIGESLQRLYSGQSTNGKTVTAMVAVIPRDGVDRTGFGGLRILGSTTAGNVEALKQRVSDLAASVKFAAMEPQTRVRQYLAVGEWSFTGPISPGESGSAIGRQWVWLCTGKLAYKQSGYTANTVLDAADGKLLTGTWEAYAGVGQPIIYMRIDGDPVPKLFPISLQTESKAFTWRGKQFLGTDRGCELGLPTQLWSPAS